MGSSHENRYTFLIISHSFFLRMRNVSDRSCTENQNTLCVLNNFFNRKSCHLWGNVEKYCRAGQATDDNIICRMCTACWIPKSKNTQSEYVIRIASPLWQWLHEHTSMLSCTYIACLVKRLWWWHVTFIFDFLEFVRDQIFWREHGNWSSKIDATPPFCWEVQMKCVRTQGNGWSPEKRLRWSRGSVLAFGTRVRGFKPGRSRRIF